MKILRLLTLVLLVNLSLIGQHQIATKQVTVIVTAHSVTLNWNASTSAVAGYRVYRGTVSGGPYTVQNTSLIVGTNYINLTVQPGAVYYYVVRAVDSSNVESIDSNQVQAVMPNP